MSEYANDLTLTEVSQCIHLSVETVITIVDHGIVQPRGHQPQEWLFEPDMLGTLRRASRLQRDLELDWEAIALALDPGAPVSGRCPLHIHVLDNLPD